MTMTSTMAVAQRAGRLLRRFSGLPLRWQIGGLVLVGLVIIFTLFGLLGAAIAQDGKQRTVNQWLSITKSTAGFLDSEVDEQFERLERAGALVSQANGDVTEQRRILFDALGQPESFVSTAFMLDPAGNLLWSNALDGGPLQAYVHAYPDVLTPARTGQRYASGVHALAGQPAAILSVPLMDVDEQPVGVIGEVISPAQGLMSDLVASARGLAKTGHAELVDQYGRVVASSEPDHALGPGEHPDFYGPLLAKHQSGIGATRAMAMSDQGDTGQLHVMAFVPLDNVPWGLALGGSEAELSADANQWQHQILLFGGITLLLALGLVWLTTRGVALPIEALTSASRRIASGDLSTPIPHEGEGEVRVLAEAFDDMRTDLQTALTDLAIEKSRYEGIVGSMADAVVTTDMALHITAFNPAASVLTGWSKDEVVGRAACELICAAKGPPSECRAACPLLANPPQLGVSKEVIRTREGREVHVAVTRSAIRDHDGHIAGVVHVLRDISAEEELSRLKDEFLSTVSHELRTPLGFIKGYALTPLLPDAPNDPQTTRHCLEVIAAASDELEELVGNLLDMTKIGAGTLSVSPTQTRLRPLVHAAIERSRLRSEGRHHFLMLVPASLPAVWADARRVEQVLYNLLDNAIKYSPNGGHIAVKAHQTSDEVTVSVIDEGLGVSAGELPALFQRFYRGQAARERGIGGSGLGLAICRGIVEAHGGRIWAESPAAGGQSAEAPGMAIRFTLPVAPARRGSAGLLRKHTVGLSRKQA